MPRAEGASMTVLASPDDETLVRLAREGSRSACEELFQRHRAVAYRVAFRLLNNEQDALDAVQDGFLKAFLALVEFDGRSVFRTWLIRIVSNAAIDLGRKRNRRSALNTALSLVLGKPSENGSPQRNEPAAEHDPSQGLHNDDIRKALNRALGQPSRGRSGEARGNHPRSRAGESRRLVGFRRPIVGVPCSSA